MLSHLTANYSKIVDDTAYPILIMALILFAFGPGLFSIDGVLKKICRKVSLILEQSQNPAVFDGKQRSLVFCSASSRDIQSASTSSRLPCAHP